MTSTDPRYRAIYYRAPGEPEGQLSGVRLLHVDTGVVVSCHLDTGHSGRARNVAVAAAEIAAVVKRLRAHTEHGETATRDAVDE